MVKPISIATAKQIKQYQQALKSAKINEGDKVKINAQSIREHPDYDKKFDMKYNQFVDDNEDKVFTVEYEKSKINGAYLIVFAEDTTDPKWIWDRSNLILVEG